MIVDVYQDTVCPWCRIGARNLETALARWPGEPVTVRWQPFDLRPEMPAEGRDFLDHMAAIKGDRNVQPIFDRVCAVGEACDLTFRFDRIARMPNTLDSHVLMAAAPDERRTDLLYALHHAYFEGGEDIGDRETLLAIAAGIGLDRVALVRELDDPALRAAVAERAGAARAAGITGVPFFVVDNAITVSGAQSPDVLLAALEEAARAGSIVLNP